MSKTTINYVEQCRLCLKKTGIYDVFQTPELAQEIFLCIGMQITKSNTWPQRICMKCYKIITNTRDLRKLSIKCELLLKRELNCEEDLLRDTVQQSDKTNNKSNSNGENNVSSTNDSSEDPLKVTSYDVQQIETSVTIKRERSTSPENGPVKKIYVRSDLFNSSLPEKTPKPEDGTYIEGTKYGITKRYTMSNSSPVDVSYTCAECPKSFATWKQVYLHQRTHNKTKKCPIEKCGKKFAAKGDLEKHVRTHTGEKPYKCSICNKGFTQNGTLKVHKETVHSEEILYSEESLHSDDTLYAEETLVVYT